MIILQEIIHFVLIYGCLIISFLYRKRTNSNLYIYFVIICTLETLPYLFSIEFNRFYSFSSLLYIAFFTYYFSRQVSSYRNTVYAVGLFSFFCCLIFIFNAKETYPIPLAITFCAFFIILSFLYFFNQLKSRSRVYVFHKEAFWVSSALLLWSVFFLFRIIPMPWLEKNDISFLLLINNVFKGATMVSYLLFLIAVTRKH